MKNKKGFTLIELLAVIVILAIISLIATPIVLKIIKDSKIKVINRSVENYIDAISTALASSQLNGIEVNDGLYYIMKNSNLCNNTNLTCEGGTLIKVKIKGDIPTGTIMIQNGKIVSGLLNDAIMKTRLTLNNKTFIYNNNKLEEEMDDSLYPTLPTTQICQAVTNETKTNGNVPRGNYELGDEYICDVDETNIYHFFILSTEGNNVNLILDRNIASNGTLATRSNKSLVIWVKKSDYNDPINYGLYGNNNRGPITAMNFVDAATKNWTKIPNINMDYIDEGNRYGKILTNGVTTTITMKNETITATYTNLKARLPKLSEVTGAGCTMSNDSCPLWIENSLDYYDGIFGYWLLSSDFDNVSYASYVHYNGYVKDGYVYHATGNYTTYYGVRPVITVLKSNIS